jgi:hypothetical protein
MTPTELDAALEAAHPGASKLKALSIRQPWPHRIFHKGKPVENRSQRTHFRGEILVHAGLQWDRTPSAKSSGYISTGILPMGGIVGIMDIVDCVTEMDSPWFTGPFGWVIENARPPPLIPCKGALGFFHPKPYED